MSETYSPVFLAVAPNGPRRTRADHPALPITIEEVAQAARDARDAGAAMASLHLRDDEGAATLDPGILKEALAEARLAVGRPMVLQISTESEGAYGPERQVEALRAVRPEAASFALRELAPRESDAKRVSDLLAFCRAERIAPQIVVHERDDAERLARWVRAGCIDGSAVSALFVCGSDAPPRAARPADVPGLVDVCRGLVRDVTICAFGPREAGCAVVAGLLGAHVRCGFENNVRLPDGRLAPSNGALVAATAAALRAAGLPLGDASALRALWGIEGR